MGEEKPDEELMGKRKSSPRLSTTYKMSLALALPVREVLYIGRGTFFKWPQGVLPYFRYIQKTNTRDGGTKRESHLGKREGAAAEGGAGHRYAADDG
ncbi:hypothetical protein FE782_23150 [Paenibacillus antri]|uniref:Uncharacterized protein n=1 Tax=Paenibacillus antri TaxID=2582848 RepID=A0A5R9G0R3_9BACL|nr:hypothetical protein FE782_23150 [Paenibacillus antri]